MQIRRQAPDASSTRRTSFPVLLSTDVISIRVPALLPHSVVMDPLIKMNSKARDTKAACSSRLNAEGMRRVG